MGIQLMIPHLKSFDCKIYSVSSVLLVIPGITSYYLFRYKDCVYYTCTIVYDYADCLLIITPIMITLYQRVSGVDRVLELCLRALVWNVIALGKFIGSHTFEYR